jgi:hypothetical protein
MPIRYVTPPAPAEKKLIGTEKTGIIELEIGGGLETGEEELIQEIMQKRESAYVASAMLAAEIAEKEKITNEDGTTRPLALVEARSIIVNSIFGQDQADTEAENIAIKYAKKIEDVGKIYAGSSLVRRFATVTAVLMSRNDKSHTYEETLKLPLDLTNAIYEAVTQEMAKDDEGNAATPPTEEELGKQPEDTTSQK